MDRRQFFLVDGERRTRIAFSDVAPGDVVDVYDTVGGGPWSHFGRAYVTEVGREMDGHPAAVVSWKEVDALPYPPIEVEAPRLGRHLAQASVRGPSDTLAEGQSDPLGG